MSESTNMDVLLDSSLSERSLSPEQPSSELKDGFTSGNGCSELVVQKSDMRGDAQVLSSEASLEKFDPHSLESLKVSHDSAKDLSFESLKPQDIQYTFESASVVPLEQKQVRVDEITRTRSAETGIELSKLNGPETSKQSVEGMTLDFNLEQMRPPQEPFPKSAMDDLGPLNGKEAIVSSFNNFNNLGLVTVNISENPGLHQAEQTQQVAVSVVDEPSLGKGALMRSRKRKSKVVAPVSTRVLRSRSQEKSKAPESKLVEAVGSVNEETKRKRRKRKRMKRLPVNEFSRIRTHLRYLLHRIKYEQNLIDAYSGEGWKGQSLEKIKPEKELQRAKSQIFRFKLKIRDLFQQLDISLAQGKLPESLFDSEGQIDSEDIFCAKCGSKDFTTDNDIILCDGACERGFHQFCLEPPLSKADIPPDDEGWLCPGCDCKVDCVKMLNDFQGSTFSILDNWEKVYPEEAAAAAPGKNMDDKYGLPSNDSEDDGYNAYNPEHDHSVLEDETSSEELDYSSASDDMVPSLKNQQVLGLPSDDSEDDDFDPSAPEPDQHAGQESSGSDFTSDSEDLDAVLNNRRSPGNNGYGHEPSATVPSKPDVGVSGGKIEVGKARRRSLNDELLYLFESDTAPISGKRDVERLDYKKLHDETYGYATSDSSDEDYGETARPRRRKNTAGRAIPLSGNEIQGTNNGLNTENVNHDQDESEHLLKEKSHKKLDVEGSNNVLGDLQRCSSEIGSSVKSTTRPYKRFGESVIQRLLESFKENQYPKQDVKESLATELGLRIQQVSKWFENARWSFRHSSRMDSMGPQCASRNGTSSLQMNEKSPELQPSVLQNSSCNRVINMAALQPSSGGEGCDDTDAGESILVSEGSGQISGTVDFQKRKRETDNQVLIHLSSVEMTPKQDGHVDTEKTQAVRRSNRLQSSSSTSVL